MPTSYFLKLSGVISRQLFLIETSIKTANHNRGIKMFTLNISKVKNDGLKSEADKILHQLINAVSIKEQRQKFTDVYLIENIIDSSINQDNLMQDIANKLGEVGFKNIKVHALVGLNGLHKGAQIHVDVLPKSSNQSLSFVNPQYLNVFVLSAESSIEYLEAQRLLEEENQKTYKNNSIKNKSIEVAAIQEYIEKIKAGAISVINAKDFKHEFDKPHNTFLPFENDEQRKIRIGHINRTHQNYSYEKDRQIATALIAKKIAQLEQQCHISTSINHKPYILDQQYALSARVVAKFKSLFLTNLVPMETKKIKKMPAKLLQDLQLLNAVLDKVEASQWQFII
jgi:hypothetical protein